MVPQLGSEDTPPRPGETWQRERLFTAVGDVLDEIASEPPGLLLLVEDLHWADESTLDLATYLIAQARSPNLRIIVTCRSDEPQLARPVVEWLARARRTPDTHEVRLGPLSREDATALVANLVAPDPADAVAADVYGAPRATRSTPSSSSARGSQIRPPRSRVCLDRCLRVWPTS